MSSAVETMISTPCTIIRRSGGARDGHGNPAATETTEAAVCAVQQRSRSEDSGEISDTAWDAFFRRELRIDNGDAFYVPGLGEFEVIGQPWYVVDETTRRVSHVQAEARRTDGPDGAS